MASTSICPPKSPTRIAILGGQGVGKTTFLEKLIESFDDNDGSKDLDSSEEINKIEVEWKEENKVDIELLDTDANEQFSAMRDLYLRGSDAFILIFALDSEKSLRELWPVAKQIQSAKQRQDVPMVLIGNKCDLGDTKLSISHDLAETAERKFGATYFETSAKYGLNVNRALMELLKSMFEPKTKQPKKAKPWPCRIC